MEKIKVKPGTEYLSQVPEFRDGLPKDCLFNKVRTGCGATTVALTDHAPTIICMPTVELIQNKMLQYVGNQKYPLLNVHSNRSVEGEEYMQDNEAQEAYEAANSPYFYIRKYLLECDRDGTFPKILVTYDSLKKVVKTLKRYGYDPKQFNLMVDEYHMLLTEYEYRRKGIQYLLKNFRIFRHFTFLTATPVEGNIGRIDTKIFLLKELKGISIIEAEWKTPTFPAVAGFSCKTHGDSFGSVKDVLYWNICRCLHEATNPYNLYIFVNSIKFINDMIIMNDLDSDNCRVIHSRSKDYNIENGIQRGTTMDISYDPKKINFLTSTAFEGADIYDTKGVSCVISNSGGHTFTDVSTKLPQIAGRVRDSIYGGTVYHLYKTSKSNDSQSKDDFDIDQQAHIQAETALLEHYIKKNRYDKLKNDVQEGKIKLKYHYLDEDTNELTFDHNAVTVELYKWVVRNTYAHNSKVEEETKKANFAEVTTYDIQPFVRLGTNNFIESVESLHKLWHNQGSESWEYIELRQILCERYPILDQALKTIGFEKIAEMKYRQGKIKKYLENHVKEQDLKNQIIKELYSEFKVGSTIPSKEAKERMRVIYQRLGIAKGRPATKLSDYFETVIKTVRIGGSSMTVNAIIINGYKFKNPG